MSSTGQVGRRRLRRLRSIFGGKGVVRGQPGCLATSPRRLRRFASSSSPSSQRDREETNRHGRVRMSPLISLASQPAPNNYQNLALFLVVPLHQAGDTGILHFANILYTESYLLIAVVFRQIFTPAPPLRRLHLPSAPRAG